MINRCVWLIDIVALTGTIIGFCLHEIAGIYVLVALFLSIYDFLKLRRLSKK